MTANLLFLADQSAIVLWIAGVQFTVFATMLLVPILLWRRRPIIRHRLALAAIIGALLSPVTAIASLQWKLDWIPAPAWALPETTFSAAVEMPVAPIDRHVPRVEAATSADSRETMLSRQESPRPASPAMLSRSDDAAVVPASDLRSKTPPATNIAPIVDTEAVGSASIAAPRESRQTTPVQPNENRVPLALSAGPRHLAGVLRVGIAIWLAGVLLLTVRTIWLRHWVGKLVATAATLAAEPRLRVTVQQIAWEIGLRSPPAVLVSEHVTNPFVVGPFRPRVVVPASLLDSARQDALRHVLMHEFCHVARRDLWIAILAQIAKTLYWWHPLVHLDAALVAQSREELCDDRVLQAVLPTDYSRTLLSLGEGVTAPALSELALFPRAESLSDRIMRLLDASRDRSLKLNRRQFLLTSIVVAIAAVAALGIGTSGAADGDRELSIQSEQATIEDLSAEPLLKKLAARSASWLAPPPDLKQLEYDFLLGHEVASISIKRGDKRPSGVWFGATLHTAFHQLTQSPNRFDVTVQRSDDGKSIRLVAKPKGETVTVSAGNGIEGKWHGYFSQGATETTIVIDPDRLVPREEHTATTTFRYSKWERVGQDKWIPRQIDVVGRGMYWRMQFDWLGSAWLLRSSESISPEATTTIAVTRNVKINGEAVMRPGDAAEQQSHEAAKVLQMMLDHNRPWLDGGETGAGWKPPFETLSYSFHTLREDVREACILTRDGVALFEIVADSLGKMRDGGRKRKVVLDTPHYATSKRGDRFARVFPRGNRKDDQPIDLALKQYARIGCQFDLPLFRYRERLDTASVTVEDGIWKDRPCKVATVSNLGRDVPLGCGTMLGFSSWSYVHHMVPAQETLYIDSERNVVLHETLTSSRDGKTFEIGFGDYVEVEPGQWAPLSIHIEAKDYFTCDYRFQLVAGRHWMLKEVVSWFENDNKSRGTVEKVAIDGDRTLLDEALKQVETSRRLFSGAGESSQQMSVATVPFALGKPIRIGPYELVVSVKSLWQVVVSVITKDQRAAANVPLVFLDAENRPLLAPSVTLTERDGVRRGSVELSGSSVWKNVTTIAVPVSGQKQAPLKVVPLEWGKTLAVNIADSKPASEFVFDGDALGREGRTRIFQVKAERSGDGSATVTLDVVSIDGMQEFLLDVPVGLFDKTGKLIAAGHHSGKLRVESDPVEEHLVIDVGKLPPDAEPAWLAIGVAPGDVISTPMSSIWGTLIDTTPPFETETLLAASDDDCRRVGLAALDEQATSRSIRAEFLDDRRDEQWIGDGEYSRRTLLRPHVNALARILKMSEAADVKALAARLIAYAEANDAVTLLRPLLEDASHAREAAAIGLTFLKQPGHLGLLRDILGRNEVALRDDADRAVWKAAWTRERDTLIALTHFGSDSAVDLLGETLLSDLNGVRLVEGKSDPNHLGGRADGKHLDGRSDRAKQIITLLGRTGNSRSVDWLTKADKIINKRQVLRENFGDSGLAAALLEFKEQATEVILDQIESGDNLGVWLNAIGESKDPTFLVVVRERIARGGETAWEMQKAVEYFWNLDSPESVNALREVYERQRHKDDSRAWLSLCEALAANKDPRGLEDAYEVLVELERPATPPTDAKESRTWERSRDKRRSYAESVFSRATPDMLATFLRGKADVQTVEEQRVVLSLLWKLPDLPEPFTAVIPRWTESADGEIGKSASRLLGRE